MGVSINILDKDYTLWVDQLCQRYRTSQIKAATKVNRSMLEFYWNLGRDIVSMKAESKWGSKFLINLSHDLKAKIPGSTCFSPTNLLYIKNFYCLYQPLLAITPQRVEQLGKQSLITNVDAITPQIVEQIRDEVFAIPWGHHRLLIDKCSGNPHKALFYIRQTIENGWSRAMLLNFIDTDLFDRQSKAITNFKDTLPANESDLAQEITRDPYHFDFTGLRAPYNERQLKDALIANIEKFLLELGTGFAYMGREFRLEVGSTEQFLDMLFYNVRLRCYVVVEVKTVEFSPSHIGQLGGNVVAVDHLLRKDTDNKTIGLLVCKTKDNVFAQYALEASSQPLGISEYELSRLYPEKVEGTMPSIEEIEANLSTISNDK